MGVGVFGVLCCRKGNLRPTELLILAKDWAMASRERSLKQVDCLTFDGFAISCFREGLLHFPVDFSGALIFF